MNVRSLLKTAIFPTLARVELLSFPWHPLFINLQDGAGRTFVRAAILFFGDGAFSVGEILPYPLFLFLCIVLNLIHSPSPVGLIFGLEGTNASDIIAFRVLLSQW